MQMASMHAVLGGISLPGRWRLGFNRFGYMKGKQRGGREAMGQWLAGPGRHFGGWQAVSQEGESWSCAETGIDDQDILFTMQLIPKK
jgi:hypothetical protein